MLMASLSTTARTVSVLTEKTKYSYYLANGAYVQYSLFPDTSLVDLIERIVAFHWANTLNSAPDVVWVRPEIASALNREVAMRSSWLLGNLPNPTGMQIMKLQTPSGPVTIEAKPDLEWPIFFGSEQELKDNSFNASMEEILCE